jgi:predicted phosphodiesterase
MRNTRISEHAEQAEQAEYAEYAESSLRGGHTMRRLLFAVLVAGLLAPFSVDAQDKDKGILPKLGLGKPEARFIVIGDSGTGGDKQVQIAQQIVKSSERFPAEFAIMLGDNLYGSERPRDYENKFERPYKTLLDKGIKFYAALGNHDDPNQRFYKPFNMDGERYYSFKAPKGGVRFFALDSNYIDQKQLDWLEKELAASGSDWKIAFFHHPPYSSGGAHGSNTEVREKLEPLFLKHGVNVVFTGHEHFYERLKPQKGIHYFIAGSSAKLRRGDIRNTELTAKGFDDGYTFMLVVIEGDELRFQTISEKGQTIDSGTLKRNAPRLTSARPR